MSGSALQIKKMRPEEKLLFACTRQNFLPVHQETVLEVCHNEEIRWDLVYAIARGHGVAPLVYANLLRGDLNLEIPRNILDRFKRNHAGNVIRKERRAEKLERVLAFFKRKSIDVMLIKGESLDILVYDQPWYTTPHDVDLVIRVKRDEIPDSVVREIEQFFGNDGGQDGGHLGIEYDYFEHHDIVMNGVLPVDFQQIWDDATKIKFKGQDVFVMSPEDMLLSLCINSCRKRFFRLKALCDIAETIYKYPGLDWSKLAQRARAYDCHNIVYTALLVTKMTVDCSLPEGALDALAVHPIRAKIIYELSRRMTPSSFSSLYSGRNLFGRKVDGSLLLSYAAFCWYQVRRRIAFVLWFTENGERRTINWPLA
jgi:hypothetical protein